MTAVYIENVEEALLNRYSGISINVAGTPTAVTVFMEDPSSEEYSERTFPSIAMTLIGISSDDESRDSEDELTEILSTSSDPVPITTNRQKGEPYILEYSIDTWHKLRASEERDLLRDAVIKKTPVRGYLSVEDIDGNTETVWAFWNGSVRSLNEIDVDEVIYHKSLSVNVHVTMLTDEVESLVPTVTEQRWSVRKHDFETGVSTTDTVIRIRDSVDDEAL